MFLAEFGVYRGCLTTGSVRALEVESYAPQGFLLSEYFSLILHYYTVLH